MSNFKPSKMTLALLSSGFIALSTPTIAAEEAQASTKKDEDEVEVIQVTGFRKSVVESINLKRYSSNELKLFQLKISVSYLILQLLNQLLDYRVLQHNVLMVVLVK